MELSQAVQDTLYNIYDGEDKNWKYVSKREIRSGKHNLDFRVFEYFKGGPYGGSIPAFIQVVIFDCGEFKDFFNKEQLAWLMEPERRKVWLGSLIAETTLKQSEYTDEVLEYAKFREYQFLAEDFWYHLLLEDDHLSAEEISLAQQEGYLQDTIEEDA